MEWILHHWPTLWMLYDPAAIRVLAALSLAIVLSLLAGFDVNQARSRTAP